MIKYTQDLYFKPMRKRSRSSGEITESGRWWKCCTGRIVEWTFEGGLKTGNGEYGLSGTEPVINQECMLVHEKVGRDANLSGTAIIRVYYRLKQ